LRAAAPDRRPETQFTLEWAITKKRLRGKLGGNARVRDQGGGDLVRSHTYEITFLGQAGDTVRAEFDDCEVTIGPGTTTLRAELPDRGALSRLVERIKNLGLDVIDVTLLAVPPGP
jgi:hypothetical protein